MKFGIRKPSIKKSIKARTTGKLKRMATSTINPFYGKKGMGFINNPKKAVYNKIYSKTTFSIKDILNISKKKDFKNMNIEKNQIEEPIENIQKPKKKRKIKISTIIIIFLVFIIFAICSTDTQTEITKLNNNIDDLQIQLENLKTENDNLKQQITNKDSEIENLKSELTNKENTIKNFENQVNTLNTNINDLQKQISNSKKQTTTTSAVATTSNIQSTNNTEMVWVGNTGTKYHKQSCRTLKGNGHQITLQQAQQENREKCKVCY